MAPRETKNNAYAKFRGDKQRALWYVMVFSGVVNLKHAPSRELPLTACKTVFSHLKPELPFASSTVISSLFCQLTIGAD